MNTEYIINALQMTGTFSGTKGSVIEIEELPVEGFRATEKLPDGTIGKRILGYVKKGIGGIITTDEVELNNEDKEVFDKYVSIIEGRIRESEDDKITILKFSEADEIFDTQYNHPNIAGNTKEGKIQIWHALENFIMSQGYRVFISGTNLKNIYECDICVALRTNAIFR